MQCVEEVDPRPIGELPELRQRIAELEAELAEQGIREAEAPYRLLVDTAPIMMWVSGPDSLCTFVNRPWLEYRGRTLEEELGDGWADGLHPDDVQRSLTTYRSSFEARQPFKMTYRLRRADGEYHWFLAMGAPNYLPDGSFAGYIGSCTEVAEQAPPSEERTGRKLSKREREVLLLVAEGKTTKEIAVTLGISYKTADSHRTKLMEKLDVHDTATLVRYAIRSGLVKA